MTKRRPELVDLGATITVGNLMWNALGRDDDEMLTTTLSPALLAWLDEQGGLSSLAGGSRTVRLRGYLGLSAQTCGWMSTMPDAAEALPDGRIRSTWTSSHPHHPGRPSVKCDVTFVPDGRGGWLADPLPDRLADGPPSSHGMTN